jgi:GR25 family glycosyltransferase involved in LPS biosynthesis
LCGYTISRRYCRKFLVRTRRIRLVSPVDPQQFREQAMVQLTELANEAHVRATSKYLPTADRQKWSRIATYVHQTANSILKAYDSHAINEKLEELTRRVEELMEEAEEPGE